MKKIYKFCANLYLRPAMNGVFHDNGYAVASDTMILVASKRDYEPEHEGKIIDRNGCEIDARYPKWREVFQSKHGRLFPVQKLRDSFQYAKKYRMENGINSKDIIIVVPVGDKYMFFGYSVVGKLNELPAGSEFAWCADRDNFETRCVEIEDVKNGYRSVIMPKYIDQREANDIVGRMDGGVYRNKEGKYFIM